MNGHITLVHSVVDLSRPDEADTLAQVQSIEAALARLGYAVSTWPVGLDDRTIRAIARRRPIVVFNLVESIGGDGQIIHVIPRLLARHHLAYTGSDSEALYTTSHKLIAKRLIQAEGLPTPEWSRSGTGLPQAAKVIVKSVDEDASFGLDAGSVVAAKFAANEIVARQALFGGRFFAETYIEGREFNISLLEFRDGVRVLPPAEILFRDVEPERPRIVDYAAKWDPSDPAYEGTPRTFAFAAEDKPLLDRLGQIALRCWEVFGLSGYARVDFRVDAEANPWVLEVNANPCLSPDAGFAAAANEAGIGFDALIGTLVDSAIGHRSTAA
jgi:D-alanine-D-alanine ligase